MLLAVFRRYAWGVLAFTVAVILWGAYVRATGSGAGCGSHWPTCNGEIVPRPRSIETVIEFTHRASSGLLGVLVVGQVVFAFLVLPKGHPARAGAALSAFFVVTEGAIGAAIVLLEKVANDKSLARAGFTAAHLTNTFLLVASLTLTAFWASGGRRPSLRGKGPLVPAGAAALAGTLLLGVSGAVTALGDTLFPAGSLREGLAQDLSGSAHFLLRVRFVHPVIGLGVAVYLLSVSGLFTGRGVEPGVRRLAALAGGLFGLQVAAGFLNLSLLAPVSMQMVHLLIADGVWISLVLLVSASLAAPAPVPAEARALLRSAG